MFNKVMDLWARTIPQALLVNEDIKLWIGELQAHKDATDRDRLKQEFQDFEALHASRFCKKCMPELDQILYEALFIIYPDYKCSCHEIEQDVLKLNEMQIGTGAHSDQDSSGSSVERKNKRQKKKKNAPKLRDSSAEVAEEVKVLPQSKEASAKTMSQLEEENQKLKSLIQTLKWEKDKLKQDNNGLDKQLKLL